MTCWAPDYATREDAEWIKPIFVAERAMFWDFGRIWYRYWAGWPDAWERWMVIRPHGFAHFRVRRDGTRVVQEIAVAAAARRQGIGSELLGAIGRPIELKTDAQNLGSNAFYQALGFELINTVAAEHGQRLMNVYRRG